MGNKKYTDVNSGTPTGADVILVADATTGELKRTTVAALLGLGGGGDIIPPTIVSRVVNNANPNQMVLTFSESVNATVAGFSARRSGANWGINSIAGSGTTWTLTMATNAVSGETLDLSYNSSTGNTLDLAGNELANFTNATVTNGVGGGGDVTAPTVVSAVVNNANPNQVVVTFSESVNATTAGWSFRRAAANWVINSLAGSGTVWTFTMATNAANGETLDRSYNPGTGNTLDLAGNELGSFTNASVTNNVAGSFDTNAQAFFNAINESLAVGSLTDVQVKNAVNQLVLDWKAITGLWAKTKVLTPYVGTTNNSMRRNIVNPADTDAAFRQQFLGSSIAYTQNGLELETVDFDDTYVSTKFNLQSNVTNPNEFAFGYYLKNGDPATSARIYASAQASGTQLIYLQYTPSSSEFIADMFDGNQRITASGANNGLISLVRQSANMVKLFRNGSALGQNTGAHTATAPNLELILNGYNNGGSIIGSKPQAVYGLFFIIDGVVSDSDMTAISAAVNTFVTALNRQA